MKITYYKEGNIIIMAEEEIKEAGEIGKTVEIKDIKELEFTIFCIENTACRLGKDPVAVYSALKESGILYGYIVPSYDVLHTQGKDYIVNDIITLMQERGVTI